VTTKADLAIYRTPTAEYYVFGSEAGFPGPVPSAPPASATSP
jgi:hypothetical protein